MNVASTVGNEERLVQAARELGAHTFGFVWKKHVVATIEALAAAGFRTFQLLASPPHVDPFASTAAERRTIRAAAAACGGRIVSVDLAASEYNLASPVPDVLRFSLQCYRKAIGFAADVGAHAITITSGRRHLLLPAPAGRMEAIFADALVELAGVAREAGLSVLFENHPQGVFPDTPSMAALLDDARLRNVALLYDVTNAFAIGEDPAAGLARVLPRVGLVHLSDAPAGAWRHDPIGSGDVDFRAIFRALQAGGYAGPIVAEVISDAPLEHLVDARARCAALIREALANAGPGPSIAS
jgi:deoxyribonuclease-4